MSTTDQAVLSLGERSVWDGGDLSIRTLAFEQTLLAPTVYSFSGSKLLSGPFQLFDYGNITYVGQASFGAKFRSVACRCRRVRSA